jgi:hypothetical protein
LSVSASAISPQYRIIPSFLATSALLTSDVSVAGSHAAELRYETLAHGIPAGANLSDFSAVRFVANLFSV